MANTFTKQDVYSIMNGLTAQVMGANKTLTVVDTETFVTVGETLLRTSAEGTLNAISELCVRTIFSVRPYRRKLDILDVDEMAWGGMVRKLTPLYKELEKSNDNNTNIDSDQLDNGESIDHYVINKPELIQTNFIGANTIQKSLTQFTQSQLQVAFRDEAEFTAFLGMVMTQFTNEIEKYQEDERRATLLNHIGASARCGMVKDLVEEFNITYGSSYTRTQLLTTYFENFVKFVIATINKDSEMLTEYSFKYHKNLDGYKPIPRHTPKAEQRMIFYEPFFIDAKANVYTSLFNPDLLQIGDYEKINFWQNIDNPTAVSVKSNYLGSNGQATSDSTGVEYDYVLGVLYDREALGIRNIFQRTATTPLNARGLYYNVFYHAQSKPYEDLTENSITYVLGDGGTVNSVTLNKSTTTIVADATETLTATTVPVGANVTWSSSDEDVATVTSGGVVTGVSAGTATITASITVDYRVYTDSCVVTITES